MEMTTFWNKTVNRLTLTSVRQQYPDAYKDLRELEAFEDDKPKFAFDVVPNIDPAGAYSKEDQEDLDKRDPDQEISDPDGPSLSGITSLMAYFPEIDELYLWEQSELMPVGNWVLWNY